MLSSCARYRRSVLWLIRDLSNRRIHKRGNIRTYFLGDWASRSDAGDRADNNRVARLHDDGTFASHHGTDQHTTSTYLPVWKPSRCG